MLDQFLVALALAGAVPATSSPDSHAAGPAVVTLDQDQARKFMDDFARCIASRQASRAAAVLAMPYGSPEQQDAAGDLAERQVACLGPYSGNLQLSFGAQSMAAGMAEYFILNPDKIADVRRREPHAFAYAQPVGLETFGACVVGQNPGAVAALVRTDVASPAETAATDALAHELAQCIAEGETLALDRPALRQLLAVSLYRHLATPPPPAQP
ncbi:MAG TPA: hypothetical protein VH392_11585 [Sphingomicrobium sp.]